MRGVVLMVVGDGIVSVWIAWRSVTIKNAGMLSMCWSRALTVCLGFGMMYHGDYVLWTVCWVVINIHIIGIAVKSRNA